MKVETPLLMIRVLLKPETIQTTHVLEMTVHVLAKIVLKMVVMEPMEVKVVHFLDVVVGPEFPIEICIAKTLPYSEWFRRLVD